MGGGEADGEDGDVGLRGLGGWWWGWLNVLGSVRVVEGEGVALPMMSLGNQDILHNDLLASVSKGVSSLLCSIYSATPM